MHNPLKLLYPDQCVSCGALVDGAHALCGTCWADTPFIDGLTCAACDLPLLGEDDGGAAFCDDCHECRPPWVRGHAALAYRANARRMVLALKHGDRVDLVRPAARWMAARGAAILRPGTVLLPVPLHWTRLFKRRYNQSALLAREIARLTGTEFAPDALIRSRRTPTQEHKSREERALNLMGAIRPHPTRSVTIAGRDVVIVDDVLTSGATLRAATEAAQAAGAARIDVLALARVVRG